ncbi:MAG: glutamate--cysteine ligase [Chromatiales bacterium]|nr:glutamate--cysteine ligase [Chromatiales bacterium]
MGEEIERRYFDAGDFTLFRQKLDEETGLLREYFRRGRFSPRGDVAGFELEAWIIDRDGRPLPGNERLLNALRSPLVVPELATFNIELNGSPTSLSGRAFSRLHEELATTWRRCTEAARELGAGLVAIGILPTVDEAMLNSAFMSRMVRYQSLNDRLMALRDGRPFAIDIDGEDPLSIMHDDVMLEAAATSFQLHLQCRPDEAVRSFNASLAIAGPLVGVSANSPFLFGHALWDETRIPLFEQSVAVGERFRPRVSFGRGYVRESLLEIFEQNQADHAILIPAVHDEPPERFSHVRFHNGTLWRWNRPLLGFDFDGQLHLRIEQRVVPAGPTLRDCIANAALYYGMVAALRTQPVPVEELLNFEAARANFYAAARDGLAAELTWPGTGQGPAPLRTLLSSHLLPLARRGLESLGITASDIDDYLGVIAARVSNGQNGAAWQRAWVRRHGRNWAGLVARYCSLQQQGEPVHTWPT